MPELREILQEAFEAELERVAVELATQIVPAMTNSK